jgi:hypothetical protein
MAKSPLNEDERQKIVNLINRLQLTPLLEFNVIREKQEQFVEARKTHVFIDGKSWGEASDALEIYSMDQNEFFAHLTNVQDNLKLQISRFESQLHQWFEAGESHAPYFPWRIIIILSKRGERDLEIGFLGAYCRHFHDRARRGSKTDEMIVARAIKKKAWDYW